MGTALAARAATATDVDYIETLLAVNGLPTADISEQLASLYVFEHDGKPIGVGGLEEYDDVALLRSVAVEDAHRGNGYGMAICRTLLRQAGRAEVSTVYLLTTTAEDFFERLGFESIDRAAVPDPIRQTREFSDLCPTTAVCMACDLPTRDIDEVAVG